ncbi:hypothetical protein B5F40_04465 [Gordonibacter sp. An230]|uniref:MFS transporter n=1 Tax=Gordonibacter sp. An230 TaxID=1965592 RepID=UPI000B3A8184|nr:MFS transporter [Gordonibacter sp. An230]OUO91045.1 hypothetical protein B5F40_04465 [Gordonibacter sp. An230]
MTRSISWGAVLACCAVMVCEGIDLVVYGNVIPSLLEDGSMSVDKAAAGNVGSLVFAGMFAGGIAAGRIGLALGSKRVVVSGVVCFSAATLLSGLSPNLAALASARFVTGVGLGVVLPIAISIARRGVEDREAPLVVSVVMSGVPIGGTIAALAVSGSVGLGWRAPLAIASVAGFAVSGLALALLPADGRGAGKGAPSPDSWRGAFKAFRLPLLVACSLATFFDLFAYYGVTTWLTQLMREFGIPLEGSLQLSLVLNAGAVAGSLGTSLVSLRIDAKKVAVASGILAGASLFAISIKPENPVALVALVAATGAFAISAQNHLNALVSNAFPAETRSSALGFTLGFGRLGAVFAPMCGGAILQAGLGAPAVLSCFGLASLAGCLALAAYTGRAVERSLSGDAARCEGRGPRGVRRKEDR